MVKKLTKTKQIKSFRDNCADRSTKTKPMYIHTYFRVQALWRLEFKIEKIFNYVKVFRSALRLYFV